MSMQFYRLFDASSEVERWCDDPPAPDTRQKVKNNLTHPLASGTQEDK